MDEPAAQQLGRLGLGDRAVVDAVPVERIQVLVGASEGAPRLVFLQREQQFHEPHGLQRLMKRRGRIGRRVAADAGDALQFGPAAGIGFARREFEGVVRIAFG